MNLYTTAEDEYLGCLQIVICQIQRARWKSLPPLEAASLAEQGNQIE